MPFTEFHDVTDVAVRFGVADRFGDVVSVRPHPVSAALREQLAFTEKYLGFRSGSGRLQRLISPVLTEVLRPFVEDLNILSGEPFGVEEPLRGFPDFVLGKRSPLSNNLLERPYLIVMEAKRDDFDLGWGQCAAAMLAAQRANGDPSLPIWGVVTNGRSWEFGRLQATTLTRHPKGFALADLDEVCGALRFVLEQCAEIARHFVAAA